MDTSTEEQRQARIHAQAQWNAHPCGAETGGPDDPEFFVRVERERYRQQYWLHDFFDYASFRGGRVLEIGTGLGTDLKQFARHGAECYGIDITDTHLSLTRRNFETEGLPLTLERSDATRIPFPDGYFDCVYSFGVIHHIPDVDAVLREVHRVLKPGGMFQVAVYHRFSVHTLSLFLRAIASGRIATLGIAGALATIELGADGRTVKPYVKLYSTRGLSRLVTAFGFEVVDLGVRQVNYDESHVLHFLRRYEGLLGWYVCARVRKPDAPAAS